MTRVADLEAGLRRAQEFLRRARDPVNGLWHDFTSSAGERLICARICARDAARHAETGETQ